jgi:type I site-specific restriction endonuclease
MKSTLNQDTVLSSLAKTQDTLQTGLSSAQDVWQQNVKRANKNLNKARKKMKPVLESAQESIQFGFDLAKDAWQQNVKNANKNLKKAKKSITDVQQSVQNQLAGYARKRKRVRNVFRLGLLVGIVLALLYTPWPGSDTRRQLIAWWQRMFQQRV